MDYIKTESPYYARPHSASDFANSVVGSGAVLQWWDGSKWMQKLPDGTVKPAGIDLSSTTATPADVLSGKLFVNSSGAVTTGTIPVNSGETITPGSSSQTISAGQYLSGAIVIEPASGGIDPSGTTATPDKVLSGYTFINSGGTMTSGTIPTVSATESGGIVTVPQGYIASSQTISAGGMDFYKCATVSGPYIESYYAVSSAGMAAVNGNYTDTGTTSGGKPVYSFTNSGTTYYLFYNSGWESWFIHTSTSFSDYAMDECLYYKSDWDEEWYTGGAGSSPAPTVTKTTVSHDLPKTWTGYKAVLNSATQIYSFAVSATEGLVWNLIKPDLTHIYTDDAMVEIASLFTGLPNDPVVYHPLAVADNSVSGFSCTYSNVSFALDSELGETVAVFNADGRLTISSVTGSPVIAFSIWQKIDADQNGQGVLVQRPGFGLISTTGDTGTFDFSGGLELGHSFNNSGWHHVYTDYQNGETRLFLDGVQVETNSSFTGSFSSSSDLSLGVYIYGPEFPMKGRLKAFRMFNRRLNAGEIAALAAEFTPSNA